ncbi:MAG TPA: Zn-dependent hydrolase [Anaerolineales bacterium]|nr:Zn-dependent hydrolase [Anaerolineales bacterium]
MNIEVNAHRLKTDFSALSQIGATSVGGLNRPSLSPAHLEARNWFQQRIIEAGLEFRVDGAGNHSAYFDCGPPGAPTLLLGSHLDTVPNGGKYDGALGVLAALEALRRVKEQALTLPVNLEAIDFTDEEGSLIGLLGSSAVAGTLTAAKLEKARGGQGLFAAALGRAGLSHTGLLSARREPASLAGYLELHIEQGLLLEASGAHIGVVTHIPGICSYRLFFLGRADHAGTVPMTDRLDAAQGASAFILALREILSSEFADCFANVGQVHFEPGAFNIVPEKAVLALEFRSIDQERFAQLESALLARSRLEAARFGLGVEVQYLDRIAPAAMDPHIQMAITKTADSMGLKSMRMPSRAGHDAQSLSQICPSGMIFVPSVGGTSHSPAEYTHWQDCLNGANVLLNAAVRLAFSQGKTESKDE